MDDTNFPSVMKALVCHGYGSPTENLEYHTDITLPKKKKNQVLIRVHAASVNGSDVRMCRADPFPLRCMLGCFKPKKNTILGSDIAGTIVAIGSNVNTNWKVGDEVVTDLSYGMQISGFAEYAVANEDRLVRKPSSISFEQVAGLPVAANTAWDALKLFSDTSAENTKKLLVNGASGGVGLFLVQLAKKVWNIQEVTAVCSAKNKESIVRDAGADHVIDRKLVDFINSGEKYDLIIDCYATRKWNEIQKVLTPNTGKYVLVGGPSFGTMLKFMMSRDPRVGAVNSVADVDTLQSLVKLMEENKLKTYIDRKLPLSEGAKAIEHLDSGDVKGKVIISTYNNDNNENSEE